MINVLSWRRLDKEHPKHIDYTMERPPGGEMPANTLLESARRACVRHPHNAQIKTLTLMASHTSSSRMKARVHKALRQALAALPGARH